MDEQKRHEHGAGSHNDHPAAHGDRHGARQPERFDPARAALLDDPARFAYLPVAEVAAMLNLPAGARLIDFGTGTGAYAIELARMRPDLEIVALDEQEEMLAMLRSKPAASQLRNLVPIHTSAIDKLYGTANVVLGINVLHEIGHEALRGMVKLLKPGGRAILIDWNAAVGRPVGPPKDHVYTAGEARERLERMGLRVKHESDLKYHYVLVAHTI